MAGVSVFNWVKNYGTINVLQDVSFEAAHGKFNGLVGPSCCGKSTLLRSIAGLESVQGGKVQQVGHPLELYDMPCNVFIATFIGSPAMNLIPVEVKAGKLATNGGQELPTSKHSLNSKFNLGIRP